MEKKLQDVKGAGHFTAAVPVTEAIWSPAEGHRHLPTAVCPKMIRNLANGGWGLEQDDGAKDRTGKYEYRKGNF